jgi:hypothetical protein
MGELGDGGRSRLQRAHQPIDASQKDRSSVAHCRRANGQRQVVPEDRLEVLGVTRAEVEPANRPDRSPAAEEAMGQ